jgi:hypothetical protein
MSMRGRMPCPERNDSEGEDADDDQTEPDSGLDSEPDEVEDADEGMSVSETWAPICWKMTMTTWCDKPIRTGPFLPVGPSIHHVRFRRQQRR